MKLKFAVVSLGLAAALGFGVGAGLKAHKAEIAKADTNTWMFRVHLNLGDEASDLGVSNVRFHCWGTSNNQTITLTHLGEHFASDYYAGNIAFTDAQTITGCQFIVTKDAADYYSNDIALALNKDNTYLQFRWTANPSTFSNSKWDVSDAEPDKKTTISLTYTDGDNEDFIANPANNAFYIHGFEALEEQSTKPINDRYLTYSASDYDYNFLYDNIEADSLESYVGFGSAQWISFDDFGTYDFVLVSNGLRIHKQQAAASSYVYYVSDSASATPNKAYTFGGDGGLGEQLGAWPGTAITAIPGVEEITNNGVVHFQNNNVRIYKIPLNLGGDNDNHIIFNYNGETQSNSLYLKPGTALWWSNEYEYTNDQAGLALDLIIQIEEIRNAVEAAGDIKVDSICGISKSDATTLVNGYKALSAETRLTYIDCSKVLTYKADKTEGNEMVSFYDILAFLANKYKLSLPSNEGLQVASNNDTTLMIVIIAVSAISLLAVASFFFIRKRKASK